MDNSKPCSNALAFLSVPPSNKVLPCFPADHIVFGSGIRGPGCALRDVGFFLGWAGVALVGVPPDKNPCAGAPRRRRHRQTTTRPCWRGPPRAGGPLPRRRRRPRRPKSCRRGSRRRRRRAQSAATVGCPAERGAGPRRALCGAAAEDLRLLCSVSVVRALEYCLPGQGLFFKIRVCEMK